MIYLEKVLSFFFAFQASHLTVLFIGRCQISSRSFSSRKYRMECYLLYLVQIFEELNSVILFFSPSKNNVPINAINYVENVRNDFVKVLYERARSAIVLVSSQTVKRSSFVRTTDRWTDRI